jgi:RND family efflux transporter MFP subunit
MSRIFATLNNLRKKLGRWFWVFLVIIVIIVWRVVVSANRVAKVETAKVTSGELVESVATSGYVKADRYSQLTFPAGGKIVTVAVKTGEKVKKGQLIAQVDAVPLNAAYQNALNEYRNTQAAVELEHDNDKNYGSAETFAQKATRTAAEVANDNAYNNLLAAEDNLRNASIYAPFDGIMDTVDPGSPGITVPASAANYTIVDPSSVYFDAQVEETDLPNVAVGQIVNIKLDAYPNKVFQGTVTSVGMVAFISSTGGNAYHVRISLPDNSDLKFRVGMGGDADIIFNKIENVLKIPATALVTDSTNYVWTIKNGMAKKVNVEIGGSNADEIQITAGLTEGEEIISQPSPTLKEGQRVGS